MESTIADARTRVLKVQEEKRALELDKTWQRHTIESLLTQLNAVTQKVYFLHFYDIRMKKQNILRNRSKILKKDSLYLIFLLLS